MNEYKVDLLDDDIKNIKNVVEYMNNHLDEDEEPWTEIEVIKVAFGRGMDSWLKKIKRNYRK